MTPQQLFEEVERQARTADRTGGPLPVALLREAAASGHPGAIYALANWHIHGKGVRKSFKRAVALLKRAAAMHQPDAEYDLAFSYETGKGGLAKNLRTAFFWYRRAANDGDFDSLTEV